MDEDEDWETIDGVGVCSCYLAGTDFVNGSRTPTALEAVFDGSSVPVLGALPTSEAVLLTTTVD